MKKILLIDDNEATRRALRRLLRGKGYSVLEAASGRQGLRAARDSRPDLVIADWVLGPGLQGVELCMRLKRDLRTRLIPIVILTGARQEFQDEFIALSKGADLFLTKDQIMGGEDKATRLFGYIRALLHRPFRAEDRAKGVVRHEGLSIDLARHAVRAGKELIPNLSTKQFDLLYVLAKNYPRAVSREYLVRAVWKNVVTDRCVDRAVSRLKERIEKPGVRMIESVVGQGYRINMSPSFFAPASPAPARTPPVTSVTNPSARADSPSEGAPNP